MFYSISVPGLPFYLLRALCGLFSCVSTVKKKNFFFLLISTCLIGKWGWGTTVRLFFRSQRDFRRDENEGEVEQAGIRR